MEANKLRGALLKVGFNEVEAEEQLAELNALIEKKVYVLAVEKFPEITPDNFPQFLSQEQSREIVAQATRDILTRYMGAITEGLSDVKVNEILVIAGL
jgi:hypothetical protein